MKDVEARRVCAYKLAEEFIHRGYDATVASIDDRRIAVNVWRTHHDRIPAETIVLTESGFFWGEDHQHTAIPSCPASAVVHLVTSSLPVWVAR